jgi:RNA-directed DNA polymerase
MVKLEALKNITTKKELADLLGVKASFLTYNLYVINPSSKYTQFTIPKKNGNDRTINAPNKKLKRLQKNLSMLLLDCIDEINNIKFPEAETYKLKKDQIKYSSTLKIKIPSAKIKQSPSLSYGFVKHRSIITNAMMHLGQKNVLNIDLENFFDSFNFGRVRGFFIKNKNFKLDPAIATVIAQIACYENKLPQGSPCSPVITNLITHILDIRLASLASKYSCTYTRYADDITFSTRKSVFPSQIMNDDDIYIAGKELTWEIEHAGFCINENKTRIQYKDSRQDVTGLVVNQKPSVKKEYWRTVRAQCNSLFKSGIFTKIEDDKIVNGNINELEGQLNFIDQIDTYNRLRQSPPLKQVYKLASHGHDKSKLISGRERTFSRFLYYRLFYGNNKPTIICEGKTDNVYLKSAINRLVTNYPRLANNKLVTKTKKNEYQLLIKLLKYSKRTRFLLELHGGTPYLNFFIPKFDIKFQYYGAPKPQHPVIILLDNDAGFVGIFNTLKKIKTATSFPQSLQKQDFKNAEFIHVIHNLYVVLTPINNQPQSMIEDFFDDVTRQIKVSNKTFNPHNKFDNTKEYSKEIFAQKVVVANQSTINFDGFKPFLDRIVKAIEHYDTIK